MFKHLPRLIFKIFTFQKSMKCIYLSKNCQNQGWDALYGCVATFFGHTCCKHAGPYIDGIRLIQCTVMWETGNGTNSSN